jgi:hypothetical protein
MEDAARLGIELPSLAELVEKSTEKIRAQLITFLYVEQNRMTYYSRERRAIMKSVVAIIMRTQFRAILEAAGNEDLLGILHKCLRKIGADQFSFIQSVESVNDWMNTSTDEDSWMVDDQLRELPVEANVTFSLGLMVLGQPFWPIPCDMYRWVAEVHGVSIRILGWERRLGQQFLQRSIVFEDLPCVHLQQMEGMNHYAAIYKRAKQPGIQKSHSTVADANV